MVWDKIQWDNILTTEQQSIFQAFVNKAEVNDYYKLSPLILTRSLSGIYFSEFCESGTLLTGSMDFHIEKEALRYKKQVQSLDENQIKILKKASNSLDSNQNAQYAQASIEFMDKMLKDDLSLCDFMNKYKNFEMEYDLDKDLNQMKDVSPLLIERNKKWIAILDKYLQSQNCFVAVGFRHLFYKQGIIQLLRQLGYIVNPIPAR